MRRYDIYYHDLGPETFVAETASKAKYQCFKALREAGCKCTFREFVNGAYVLHMGRAA